VKKLLLRLRHLTKAEVLKIAVFCLIFIAAVVASYFAFSLKKVFVETSPPEEETSDVTPAATPSGNFVNVLLLGYGGAGHDGGSLMDTIILVSLEPKEKKAALISVPRDLWVSVPTDFDSTTKHKINEAYALALDNRYPNKKPEFKGESGGWALMKDAVARVTGITPPYFISVDFTGFKKAIEILGDVEVNIPKTYDDYFYPVKGKELELCDKSPEEISELHQKYSGFELEKQFTCRYEHIHFDKGTLTMDAETAMKYVRSRHGDGDFGRSERGFALLSAIGDKAVSLGAIPKGGKLLNSLVATTRTDIDAATLKKLLALLGKPGDYKMVQIHLTEDNVLKAGKGPAGEFILYPKDGLDNFTRVRNFISETITSL